IGESDEKFFNSGCSACNWSTQRLINALPNSIPRRPKYKPGKTEKLE
ncbi:unnamed protein product, partial [Rotaria magnacalcarata]